MRLHLHLTKGDLVVILMASLALMAFSMAAATCASGPPRIRTVDTRPGEFEYYNNTKQR